MSRSTHLIAAVTLAFAFMTACTSAPMQEGAVSRATPAVDLAAEQEAIRAAARRYAAVRDPEELAGMFSEDAWVLAWGAQTPLQGRSALLERFRAWEKERPLSSFTEEPAGLVVSQAGDVAYEHGRFRATWEGETGPEAREGSFVRTWRKIDGEWKIAVDMVRTR